MSSTRAHVLRARGASMLPAIQPGALLVTRPAEHPVRAGDVVLLRAPQGLVVHRVVTTRPLRQMGDACDTAAAFRPADVAGVVVAVGQGGRTVDLTTRRQRLRARLRAARSVARLAIRRVRGPIRRPPVSISRGVHT